MQIKRLPTNWFNNEVLLTFELLFTFIENVENQVKFEIQQFNEKKETKFVDYNDYPNMSSSYDTHKSLDSTTWNLDSLFKEYFPTLQRSSALISLIGAIEHELNQLCIILRNVKKLSLELKDLNGKGIERSVRYMEITAFPSIKRENSLWNDITSIQKIRNLFVHNNGQLFDINGGRKEAESNIVKKNDFLSGTNTITINAGYLSYTLDTFLGFFKHIDGLIQNSYQ
jgi:hypothetical protein